MRSQIGTWGQSGDNSEKSGAYSVEDFAEHICGFPVRILDCMTINIQCGCCLLTPPTFWALRLRLARIALYVFPFCRMRAISPLPGNIFALCMLFEIVMARSSPHVSISRRNQAIRNAWRGNLAVKDRFSRRDARNHAWRMILAMGIAPPLRSALGMCRHGPSRAPGETLVSTERIPGQAHFWIACWAVWVSGCCGIV